MDNISDRLKNMSIEDKKGEMSPDDLRK